MKVVPMSVEYVDHLGNDNSVANAARVSFSKQAGQYTPEQNAKLISYLAIHNHWSPFAHAFVSLRIKAPIFVARQAVKHQVGLAWNEVSRRYVDDEPEFWFPKEWRGRPDNMKQGSSGVVTDEQAEMYITMYTQRIISGCLECYDDLLKSGVAPEQARMVLPLNTMTEWVWSGSLAAFSRVCKLRLDPHAQLEIQELAQGIKAVVEPLFPVSFAALMGE
jgi:thymidylate synthase (FAD)